MNVAQQKLNKFHKNLDLEIQPVKITPSNVLQKRSTKYELDFQEVLEASILEDTKTLNIQFWEAFAQGFINGKSSLILAEHKSNMDAPLYRFLLQNKQPQLPPYFDQVCFLTGRKINEQSGLTANVSTLFHRLAVVPKKEIEALNSDSEEIQLANAINFKANRLLRENLHHYIFWIFPTGTRSKIWEPQSYLGVPTLYNYLKLFDQMILLSIDGNTMPPVQHSNMEKEPLTAQNLRLNCSQPIAMKTFLEETKQFFENQNAITNIKAYTINRIIKKIYAQKSCMPWEEKWVQNIPESKILEFDRIRRYLSLIKDE